MEELDGRGKVSAAYEGPKLRLVLSREQWDELLFIARDVAPYEVSGLGELRIAEEGRLCVERLYLLEQKAGLADVELESEQVAALQATLMNEKSHDEGLLLKFWWHTHGDGEVFWSDIDEKTCADLRKCGEWFVSLVLNTGGEALARIDGQAEFGAYTLPIKVVISTTLSSSQRTALKQEIDEKVSKVEFDSRELVAPVAKSLKLGTVTPGKFCRECSHATPVSGRDGVLTCEYTNQKLSVVSPACALFNERGESLGEQ